MRPEVSQLLMTSGMQIVGLAAPTSYAQGSASMITGLLMMASVEYDRAAEVRVDENNGIRALLKSHGAKLKDDALRSQLEAAAKTTDASLRISALNVTNAELRKLLIGLHIAMEDISDRAAQKEIWTFLHTTAEARMLKLG